MKHGGKAARLERIIPAHLVEYLCMPDEELEFPNTNLDPDWINDSSTDYDDESKMSCGLVDD